MPSSPQPQVNPWIVAVAVMCATFMEVLDTTVVNVSLPHIAGSLSVTVDEAAWALTSYLVANAIILPMTGWIANYFGRKRTLLAAVFGFTAASFLCGLAPSLPALIVCRIIQGATGGALQPLSQAVMLEGFPPQDRGKAMAFWGLGIVVAPMLGPVIGGWLTDNYSWRWVFYINLPVGLLSVIMTRLFIFDPPYIKRSDKGIDYWGIGMLAVAIGALQIVLDKGQEEDWFASSWITVLTVLSLACVVIFIVHELRTHNPVVHLRVFKERTYSAGVFLMTVLGYVLYGSLLLLPIFLQTLLGYPALDAGLAMMPRGLGSFLMMPFVGTVLGRFDPRKVLAVGIVGASWTLYALSKLNLNTADHGHHESHSQRGNGQRHQHVQPHAKSGRQHGDCQRYDISLPPPAIPHQPDRRECHGVQPADADDTERPAEYVVSEGRRFLRCRTARLRNDLGHGPAAGVHGRFRRYVPCDGAGVLDHAATAVSDAAA